MSRLQHTESRIRVAHLYSLYSFKNGSELKHFAQNNFSQKEIFTFQFEDGRIGNFSLIELGLEIENFVIKNNFVDPQNDDIILCSECELDKVFKHEVIHFSQMLGFLLPHLTINELRGRYTPGRAHLTLVAWNLPRFDDEVIKYQIKNELIEALAFLDSFNSEKKTFSRKEIIDLIKECYMKCGRPHRTNRCILDLRNTPLGKALKVKYIHPNQIRDFLPQCIFIGENDEDEIKPSTSSHEDQHPVAGSSSTNGSEKKSDESIKYEKNNEADNENKSEDSVIEEEEEEEEDVDDDDDGALEENEPLAWSDDERPSLAGGRSSSSSDETSEEKKLSKSTQLNFDTNQESENDESDDTETEKYIQTLNKCQHCCTQLSSGLPLCKTCWTMKKKWLPHHKAKRKKKVLKEEENSNEINMCIFCHSKKKNTAFIHGKNAHLVSCYKCAKKSWKKHSACPICRFKVEKYVKVF